MTALHDAQVALVPESAPDLYPTVYPPQAALLFAPFSGWPYRPALLIWNVLTIAMYAADRVERVAARLRHSCPIARSCSPPPRRSRRSGV